MKVKMINFDDVSPEELKELFSTTVKIQHISGLPVGKRSGETDCGCGEDEYSQMADKSREDLADLHADKVNMSSLPPDLAETVKEKKDG